MKKYILAFLLTFITFSPVNAQQLPPGGCGNLGGIVERCVAKYGNLRKGHAVPAGDYASGGTYILKNAGCISPNARFGVHSAYYMNPADYSQRVQEAPNGHYNNIQRRIYGKRLSSYLDSIGAFNSTELTTISGEQMASILGTPLCNQ